MKYLLRWMLILSACVLPASLRAQQSAADAAAPPPLPSTDSIVSGMVAQGRWNDRVVLSLDESRIFRASNPRFRQEAMRQVRTKYRAPGSYDSVIVKEDGSGLIRQRVFDPILAAEKQAQTPGEKGSYDILPENYEFHIEGLDSCGSRKCYRLAISPRRKNKFLLDGFIWVDAEDYGIAKVQGAPSKRISFWVVKTRITRTYSRMGDVWLTERIESDSDVLIAGHSGFSIDYEYSTIEKDENCRIGICPAQGR